MKRLLIDLRDPLGLALAGATAVACIVLGQPLAISIAAGVAVLGVRVGVATLGQVMSAPRITAGSPEAHWIERAEMATSAFRHLARSARSSAIGDRFHAMGDQTAATVDLLRRLASQTSTVDRMLRSIDKTRLSSEEWDLTGALRAAETDPARREISTSLSLIREQLAARQRLEQTRSAQMARLQSGVLALEGLGTRLAEVVALGETAAGSAGAIDRVAELADELEGLRGGLSELDQMTTNPIAHLKEE